MSATLKLTREKHPSWRWSTVAHSMSWSTVKALGQLNRMVTRSRRQSHLDVTPCKSAKADTRAENSRFR